MSINVLISAVGTAAGYYLAKTINKEFSNEINVIGVDTHPKYLLPAAHYLDEFYQVPPIKDEKYKEGIVEIIKKNSINIFVPLIDHDLFIFHKGLKELEEINCFTSAPTLDVLKQMSDKKSLQKMLETLKIKTPKLYSKSEIEEEKEYFVKPRIGFGSRGTFKLTGKDIIDNVDFNNNIVQELCKKPEITVDVFFDGKNKLEYVCRDRLETKSGVSVKAKVYRDERIEKIILKLSEYVELPLVSCIQFMTNTTGDDWLLTDANMRVGGGSPLSVPTGFDVFKAMIFSWLGETKKIDDVLKFDNSMRYTSRAYVEYLGKF